MKLGIVGNPAVGKDTLADYLVERYGFLKIDTGSIVRELMVAQGLSVENREDQRAFAAKCRQELGNDFLCQEAIRRAEGKQRVIFNGLRNTSEVATFREEYGNDFKLIAVDVSMEASYSRAQGRGRLDDGVTFEQFKRNAENEKASNDGSFTVNELVTMAEYVVWNNSSVAYLYEQADLFISEWKHTVWSA